MQISMSINLSKYYYSDISTKKKFNNLKKISQFFKKIKFKNLKFSFKSPKPSP